MASRDGVYVVVTRTVTAGRKVIHTYGPYTRSKATRVRYGLRRDLVWGSVGPEVEVSVCKLIDTEAMNAKAATRDETNANSTPICNCDPAAHLGVHRPWCATRVAR